MPHHNYLLYLSRPAETPHILCPLHGRLILITRLALISHHLLQHDPAPLPVPQHDLILYVEGQGGVLPRAQARVGVHAEEACDLTGRDTQAEGALDGITSDFVEHYVGKTTESVYVTEEPNHFDMEFRAGIGAELEVGLNNNGQGVSGRHWRFLDTCRW